MAGRLQAVPETVAQDVQRGVDDLGDAATVVPGGVVGGVAGMAEQSCCLGDMASAMGVPWDRKRRKKVGEGARFCGPYCQLTIWEKT